LVLRETLEMAAVLVILIKVDVSRESMTNDTCVLVSQMFLLLGKDGVGVSFVRKRCPLRV
jgi:predicted molibdopterin-dependent oxidoreductase YjgC